MASSSSSRGGGTKRSTWSSVRRPCSDLSLTVGVDVYSDHVFLQQSWLKQYKLVEMKLLARQRVLRVPTYLSVFTVASSHFFSNLIEGQRRKRPRTELDRSNPKLH